MRGATTGRVSGCAVQRRRGQPSKSFRANGEIVSVDQNKPLYQIARPSNGDDLPVVQLDQAHAPDKVLAHGDLLRKFIEGQEIRPIHLRIGIMGACNMRCNFCNFHSPNEENFYDLFSFKDSLSTEKSIGLLREFAAADGRAVTFCGSGECTIHPGYADICYAGHDAGLRIGLITNGSRLRRKKVADAIVNTHTWVRVGLNAGTEATFNEITRDRENTLASFVDTVGAIRSRATDPDFRIGFNYVITMQNYAEIRESARLAKAAGAHYVRYEPEFYSALGHETILDVMSEVSAALDEVSELATDEFEVSTPKLDRGPMDQVEEVEGDFERCHYSRFVTAIGADGHLYPCPQVHLNSRYRIGNVIEDGYQNVLEGGPRAEWEATNPRRTDLCKSCFYRPQNELLELLHRGQIQLDDALRDYQVEVPRTLHADFV
jgi:radical SAM protein with 4Fe4S-binding SPASM domain